MVENWIYLDALEETYTLTRPDHFDPGLETILDILLFGHGNIVTPKWILFPTSQVIHEKNEGCWGYSTRQIFGF